MRLEQDSLWKARFRVPVVRGMQVAAQAPARGLISSNLSGAFQLHAWDLPSGQLRQLTSGAAGVFWGVLGPDGRFVYYHDDVGGNELGHFVRVSFDGGVPESITPAMPPYPTFGLASNAAGNRLGFVTAAQGNYCLYVIDIGARGELGSPQCLLTCSRLLVGPVFSCDGALAVVAASQGKHTRRCELIALDALTGAPRGQLGYPDGHLDAVGFAPLSGDMRLLVSSDRTGVDRPLIWDVATGAVTDVEVQGLDGGVRAADWSRDGRRLLLVQFSAAAQRLHSYDVEAKALAQLSHPSGTYKELGFASDDTIYALWEDSENPPQVVTLDSATGALSRALQPAKHVPPCRRWRSVSFASSDGQQVQGWLAVPEGKGPFPAILHAHGGPEFAMTDLFFPQSQMWLDHGFAFLTVNYRGSTTFGREFYEQIWGDIGHWEVEDMAAARQWLIRENIADGSRVFLTGWSYGGYITLQALGTKPELWAGGMAGIAVADWAMAHEDTTETLRGLRAARFGGTPEEQPERYAASSPLTYARAVRAPVLIIQGRNDTRTPPRSVAVYEERMKALGKVIEVHWLDAGHGSLVVEQAIEHYGLMLQFACSVAGTPVQ